MTTTLERPGRDSGLVSYRSVVRRLSAAQKPGGGVPAYTRYVNRQLGRRLAALAYLARLMPDQVTVLSAAASLAGVATLLLAPRSYATAGAVSLLLLLGYALDSADGQLARLRGGGSPAGEWLDHVVDSARLPIIHAAVLVALQTVPGEPVIVLVAPLGYLIVSVVRYFTMMLTEQMLAAAQLEQGTPHGGRRGASVVRSLVVLPVDFGVLALAFLFWGSPSLFARVYLALFLLNLLWLGLTLVRRYREVSRVAMTPGAGS